MNRRPTGWFPSGSFDVALATVGLLLAVVLLPLVFLSGEAYVQTVPVVLGLGCAVYLLTARRGAALARSRRTLHGNGVVAAELTGLGLVAVATLAFLEGTRTLPVLLLSGAVGAFILLQIVFLDDDALDARLVLAQVVAHAFVVRFSGLFTTAGFVGVDSWEHVTQYAASVLEAGSLSPLSDVKYYFAPFHHLVNVVSTQLLGVSLRLSLYLVIGSVTVLGVALVYGTARYFVDVRWALFATGAFAMTDQAIRWGMHIIPESLGLVFFLGVVFAVTRLLHARTTRADWALLVGFIVAITLTHQVSAFVSLVFVGSAVLAQVLVGHVNWAVPAGNRTGGDVGARSRDSGESAEPITDGAGASPTLADTVPLHGAFAFHLVFTGAVWAVTPWSGEHFLTRAVGLLLFTLRTSAGFLNLVPSGGGAATAGGSGTLMAAVAGYVDAIGFLVLLFAAVVGCLALVRRHRSPQASHTVVIAIGVMLFFSLGLPLFGIRTFLPGRWYAFAYALMAVAGAVGLRYVGLQFSTRVVTAALVVLVLAFPFAMVAGKKATLDDPTFDDQWPKYSYTESEIDAMYTIGETTPAGEGAIYTDHPWRTAFRSTGVFFGETINLTAIDGSGPPHDRVVYRTYQSTGAPQFTTDGGVYVTRQVSRDEICPVSSDRVYDNQNAELCTRPGA